MAMVQFRGVLRGRDFGKAGIYQQMSTGLCSSGSVCVCGGGG